MTETEARARLTVAAQRLLGADWEACAVAPGGWVTPDGFVLQVETKAALAGDWGEALVDRPTFLVTPLEVRQVGPAIPGLIPDAWSPLV